MPLVAGNRAAILDLVGLALEVASGAAETLRGWTPAGYEPRDSLLHHALARRWSEALGVLGPYSSEQSYAQLFLAAVAAVLGERETADELIAGKNGCHRGISSLGSQGFARCLIAFAHDLGIAGADRLVDWALPGLKGEELFGATCEAGDPSPGGGIRQPSLVANQIALRRALSGASLDDSRAMLDRAARMDTRGHGLDPARRTRTALQLAETGLADAAIELARGGLQGRLGVAAVALVLRRQGIPPPHPSPSMDIRRRPCR